MTTSPTLATKTTSKESLLSSDSSPSKIINHEYETRQRLESNFAMVMMNGGDSGTGKGLVHYLMNPRELREDHPVWHYFYLCTLIFAAFVSLFIGPVIFGMLAAIGGIVVFAVVCIVALVRILGLSAEWVLDTLWYGGNDLLEISKQQILTLCNIPNGMFGLSSFIICCCSQTAFLMLFASDRDVAQSFVD
ncbi:8457_t:CDS:2 [Racocetra persica]|uniref:8457_t:CDS:1 n=1 Tax=Racocetra persica TaxID=160502 RepID=A0ACA9KPW1_9GLOM|nr:8457_t:CDS:2 [Racocetra persica]